jgi:hypothetical protein
MKTHMLTSTRSPMNDADLRDNFNKMRYRYWTSKGLFIPAGIDVVFRDIKKRDKYGTRCVGSLTYEPSPCKTWVRPTIGVCPEHKFLYFAAKLTLLHEMAHLYVDYNFDRRHYGHGKTFYAEIDRLYSLGAFRELI